jgi:hypothetical protein
MILIPLLSLVFWVQAGTMQAGTTIKVNVCSFTLTDRSWSGSCGRLGGENPKVSLAMAERITTGKWRSESEPRAVWAGKITYSDDEVPIEVEIHPGDRGVLRSADGWYPISRSMISDNALKFEVDFANEIPPSDLDREIVEHAAAILSSEAVWNRADTRVCHPTDTKWSIYCAMEKGTIDVTGGFHHRRPALQVVRKIVEEGSAGRPYEHRLMDYNNDPTTRFVDVRSLFAEALRRMEQ